jgi:hypothetical protein
VPSDDPLTGHGEGAFSDDDQLDGVASVLQAFSDVSDHAPFWPEEVTADVAASASAARRAAVAGGSGGSP